MKPIGKACNTPLRDREERVGKERKAPLWLNEAFNLLEYLI